MLREFLIENLGRLRRALTPANHQCGRLTLIFAPNGYGKTTFSSALRAAETGDPVAIRGRKSLGNAGAEPRVVLTFEDGTATYENGGWDAMRPRLSMFDGTFIAENVHAAETISLDMRRSMFSVVLGREGIALYDDERAAVAAASAAQREEADARAALRNDHPGNMTADRFLVTDVPENIGELVEAGTRRVAAAREAATLQALRLPEPLPEVGPVPDLFEALAASLPGTDEQSEAVLVSHRDHFGLHENGERWLMYGTQHIVDDGCPFCGRDEVDALGLATIYRALFSDQYVAMTRRVQTLEGAVEASLGQEMAGSLVARHAQNLALLEPWRPFCDLGDAPLPDPALAMEALRDAATTATTWVVRKKSGPGSIVNVEEDERAAYGEELERTNVAIRAYNDRVEAVRALMVERREGAAGDDVRQATEALAALQLIQRKPEAGVQERCERLRLAIETKRAADLHKEEVRGRLRQAVQARTAGFEGAVNGYLRDFNASFEIEDVRHTFPGGVGSTGYALRIRNETVAAAHGQDPAQPSFKNTLSTGDKTTLALAFFLARLDAEPDLADRTVVFDDPFSSHDRFRQSRTIEAIRRLVARCAQVIVLSHDEMFLRQISNAAGNLPQTVYELRLDEDNWAVIETGDLDDLNILGQEQRIRDIRAFVDDNRGDENNVALMLRQTLEHRYRNAFPGLFGPTEMLGGICAKIEQAGAGHECRPELEELQMINRETREEHHGEDRAQAVEHRWDRENLRGLARATLRLARA